MLACLPCRRPLEMQNKSRNKYDRISGGSAALRTARFHTLQSIARTTAPDGSTSRLIRCPSSRHDRRQTHDSIGLLCIEELVLLGAATASLNSIPKSVARLEML